MEIHRGIPLLFQQFKALSKKNALLSWRHKSATSLQLFSSLVFILLMFCIQKAIEAQFQNTTYFENVLDPNPIVSPSIPPCEDKFFIKLPCFDFLYSGNSSSNVNLIVSRILANNPNRPIPSSKIKSFATEAEVDAWLLSNPMYSPGALHFVEKNATIISYGVQTNSTALQKRGRYEDPTLKFQIPLQIAAEREIARFLIGDRGFSWTVGLKEFAHPPQDPFSVIGTIGPTFFLAVAMFGFVFQLSSLVMEKELKLREAMNMMGLYDTAYWMSWIAWEGLLVVISSILIVLFGMMFQFDFFLHNNFAILFLVFCLFQLNMTAFAFALSAFISQSSSATNIGFYNFIIGLLTQIVTVFGFPYSDRFPQSYRVIWSFYPPNLLAKALQMLTDATRTPQDPGMSWSGRTKCPPNDDECILTMNDVFIWLLGTFVMWFVLALYFDNIIPNPYGVRKSVFYFLYPGYWTGKGGSEAQEGGVCTCFRSSSQLEHVTPEDEDVLQEETTVKQQAHEGIVDPNTAVQIRGLTKTYPGSTSLGCCKCNRTPPYHALRGLWVNLAKDQLFCLLGPNGAGKTTAINCLTGITPVTSGDALIHGNSVRSSVGMSNIRRIIGVCPQFDILWGELTGQEHLYLFANIKGLRSTSISTVVENSLAEVRLTNAAKMRASSYSGGMKRRLSVAIALIGDPKLIILDEPTTGMDPISRRHVWDIIENAKQGRAIILTTHSMEEADILSDRIGIMAKGRLRCIGTSIRLKSRFGTGFIANVSFVDSINGTPVAQEATDTKTQAAVKQFFKHHLGVEPKEENVSFLTFVIPHEKEHLLTNFFDELQEREEEFGIADIQLGLTSLEEVFLNIARQAEMESAAAEGKMVTLNLTTSDTSVEIPVGARYVGIPETETAENPKGLMVEVYWEQDDSGALCISGHSREVPIPVNVELPITSSSAPTRGVFGGRGKIQGLVINPDQISESIFRR
ncbi:ABC transporter A family member 2-like [Amaranthus tricolor]|uniref:ABC transporter A family member 2-like n=1 Tax=Amaranthus tricolor TaxID=29722 RepID=UPI0025833CD3|nr:ABC transporter A family member 2-like [Amaranthus tricolor]